MDAFIAYKSIINNLMFSISSTRNYNVKYFLLLLYESTDYVTKYKLNNLLTRNNYLGYQLLNSWRIYLILAFLQKEAIISGNVSFSYKTVHPFKRRTWLLVRCYPLKFLSFCGQCQWKKVNILRDFHQSGRLSW